MAIKLCKIKISVFFFSADDRTGMNTMSTKAKTMKLFIQYPDPVTQVIRLIMNHE